MFSNAIKMFLLVICFMGGALVASESKNVYKISDEVSLKPAIPTLSFCQNPGKHKAIITDKKGYTVTAEGPFFIPREKANMWIVFITMSEHEKIFSNRFTKAIHSVEWEREDSLRVTLCDGNFCFLRIE